MRQSSHRKPHGQVWFAGRVALVWCVVQSTVAALAADLPAQFQAWGSRGGALPDLQPGWTEAPAELHPRQAPEPSPAEAKSGFILFERHPFTPIYHDTVPAAFERTSRLQAFGAQGQFEPLSFAIYALAAMAQVRVAVTDLKGPGGGVIAAGSVDIRWVRPVRSALPGQKRFALVPFYLEKRDCFSMPRAASAQVWLTVAIPETAKGGDYEGKVRIEGDGKGARELPLVLRVLPFRLPPVPLETAVSYLPTGNPAITEKELIDQREHGITANESALGAQVVSRDRHFGEDDAAATRRSIQSGLRLRRKIYGETANRFPLTVEVGHQVLYEWDGKKGWFDFWPHSRELEADFFKAVNVCREALKTEGAASMRVFIMDEPGGHPDTLEETVYYHKLLKARMPDLETYVTLGGGMALGIDELGLVGPFADLVTVNRFDREICEQLTRRGKPYGIYNGGGATEQITGYSRDRYFFGFYGWKTGANEILQWVYRFGDPWKEPLRGNHGYVMPAPDGPLPSIPWEGVRAGVDDCRYLDLLWRLITAARQNPNAANAAKSAEAAVLKIVSQIDFSYQPRTGEGTAAPACSTLDKWRWIIAKNCIELLKVVSLEQAFKTTVRRPGPLELPESKRSMPALGYGAEMLSITNFESGAGPWKMVGPPVSRGGLDETAAHSGKASFLLENAASGKGTDVAVCVWGWSGPGPDITLAARKTYEFSAFTRSASAKPQIRLSVPEAAVTRDNEGEDETDGQGWRRCWRQITVRQDVKPRYLAVWLQGPGKIWADDLSLREVIFPPFILQAGQNLIDGSDKIIPIHIRHFGSAEISVRLRLPGAQEPQIVKVPALGEAVFDLNPAGMGEGRHELIAELLNAGISPYSISVTITRVRGPFE